MEFYGLFVFLVEQFLNNNKKTLFSIMDIEMSTTPVLDSSIFTSISEFNTFQLYQQQVALESSFFASPHHTHQSLMLTLIDNTLLLSDPNAEIVQPHSAVALNFDLKFEVLYQTQKNVFSSKIGFRLFNDTKSTISFFSPQLSVIEAWILVLSRHINQKGFHEMFKPLKKLGKGNFASVYEVERVTDHAKFAVKAFSKQSCFNGKNGKESLINELTIMRELSQDWHPNLLRLEGVYESDNSIYVVLELLNGGQLFHRIQQLNGHFSVQQVKEFMFGLLGGLKHMHQHRIMHRDLKPENIMLRGNSSMVPVIVDFGLATNVDLEKYLFFRCGTPGYVAPEIIQLNQSKPIQPECDIFSAGVIFHILLTRKALFEGTRYEEVYKKNKEMNIRLEGDRYSNLDPRALQLLKKMLSTNPKERITAAEALEDSYFQDYFSSQEELGKPSSPCPTKVSDCKSGRAYYI